MLLKYFFLSAIAASQWHRRRNPHIGKLKEFCGVTKKLALISFFYFIRTGFINILGETSLTETQSSVEVWADSQTIHPTPYVCAIHQ